MGAGLRRGLIAAGGDSLRDGLIFEALFNNNYDDTSDSNITITPVGSPTLGADLLTLNGSQYCTTPNSEIGDLLDGASAISFVARVKVNDASKTFNTYLCVDIASGGNTGIFSSLQRIDASSASHLIGGRSQSGDAFQQASATVNYTWGNFITIGAVFDFANDENHLYLDGSLDQTSSVSYGASVYTQSTPSYNDTIGNRTGAGTTQAINGDIDFIKIWDRLLTADEMSDVYSEGD